MRFFERIKDFLAERERFLAENGICSPYLFPNLHTAEPYSGNAMRKIKKKYQEMSGVDFKLKDMRTTFATLTVGEHMERIDSVSMQLRHSSVKTTQSSYVNSDRSKPQKNIMDAWKETEIRKNYGDGGSPEKGQ